MLTENIHNIFSLQEEKTSHKRDKYNRFLYQYSERKDNSIPWVSMAWRKTSKQNIAWPHQKRFAVCLTHDIDEIWLHWKKTLWYMYCSLKRGKILSLLKAAGAYVYKPWSPLLRFNDIISIEKRYGAVSSFYFIATTGKDARYPIAACKDICSFIEQRGSEVGLHGSRDSYTSAKILKEEKLMLEEVLGHKVEGIRQHYLCFDANKTWQAQQDAGFRYDCTLGYPDNIGFRNGCAHAFHPHDNQGNQMEIWEIPLIIMDATFPVYLGKNFQKDKEEIWKMCTDVIDTVAELGGAVSILWHNDRFDEVLHPGAKTFYEELLAYIDSKGGWMTSGKHIIDHLETAQADQ